jgi:hypothetical protein
MSKGLSYKYTGTKGHIIATASNLPQTGQGLVNSGWEEISHSAQAASGHHTYKEPATGLRIRYDEPNPKAKGFAGKNHFHILNPNATSSKDMYLDKNGNPVKKNSKASHIVPKGD